LQNMSGGFQLRQKQAWEPEWSEKTNCWTVDFNVNGKRIRRRLPIHAQSLEDVAYARAKEIYGAVWRSTTTENTAPKVPTFVEASELYVQTGGEARYLPKIVGYFGRKCRCNEIDEIAIARAGRALYPYAKPETIRRQLRVPIKAVLNFAAGNRRTKLPDSRRTRWLSPEEAERLLCAAACPEAANLRDPNFETLRKIAFMLGTGAAPGETMSLDGKHWNPATREWWLPGTKTVYRARFVRLPQRSVDLIQPIPNEGPAFPAPNGAPYVFRKNRGGQMAVAFRKIRDAAGLGPEVVPYTCRHTWATWSYAQTKDWAALLDQGGWNRADTANRYRKIAPLDLGRRLLSYGWDFRADLDKPVRFGEMVSLRIDRDL
jgi:integrase